MEYRIGIDLGGTGIKTGVVNEEYRIIARDVRPTDAHRPFCEVVADMAASAAAAARQAGLEMSDIRFVGVGSPGSVRREAGVVVHAGNTGWHEQPLRDALQSHLPLPVQAGNDANCAVAAETLCGAAREYENVLLFTLGTGVGGGVIVNRRIFEGGDGMGAELGHIPLVMDGEPCTCGMRGCYEAYASVTALIRQTRSAMERHPESAMHELARERGVVNGRTAFECAKAGDAAAREVVDRYLTYISAGVGGMVSVFRPEVVLIGGGISNEGAYLLDPINERLPRYVFGSAYTGVPPVRRAALGNDAGIIGAAYLDRF